MNWYTTHASVNCTFLDLYSNNRLCSVMMIAIATCTLYMYMYMYLYMYFRSNIVEGASLYY